MKSIEFEVWIDAPARRVFELLSSAEAISTWWDQQTPKETDDGLVLEHCPGPEHGTVRFLVLECSPHHLVHWRCISTHPPNVPGSEWTGTEMLFQIGARDSSIVATESWSRNIPVQTVVRFVHSGWPSKSKYFAFCSYAWSDVLRSLSKKATEG